MRSNFQYIDKIPNKPKKKKQKIWKMKDVPNVMHDYNA